MKLIENLNTIIILGLRVAAPFLGLLLSACQVSSSNADKLKEYSTKDYCNIGFLNSIPSVPNRIYRGSVDEFILEHKDKKLPFVLLNSRGGSVEDAIKLGKFLMEKRPIGIVSHWCHSACFNFLAPTSSELVVCESGYLSTHGGTKHVLRAMTEEDYFYADEKSQNALHNLTRRNVAMLEQEIHYQSKIGISGHLSDCAGMFSTFSPPVMGVKEENRWKYIQVPFPKYDRNVRGELPDAWAPTAKALISVGYPKITGWSNDASELKKRWESISTNSKYMSVDVSHSLEQSGICNEAKSLNEAVDRILNEMPAKNGAE